MDLRERNRRNIISYWRKRQAKESLFIKNVSASKAPLKAKIFGYLAGDGYVRIRDEKGHHLHNEVGFYPDHSSLLSPFITALKAVYNITPTIRKHDNFYSVRFNSKIVVEDLLKYATFGVKKWSVPNFITSNKQLLKEWLRAFFDAEGYITSEVIRVQTVNEKGIQDVQKLLSLFQIESKIYSYSPKNPKWSVNHILIISMKESRQKFLNEIGLNHKVKYLRLKESLLTD